MKVTILTLGCRVNQAESFTLEGTLKANGVTIVDLNNNPDYCIINTCTVTSKSDYNSRQLIRRAARTGAKVIATGCYSQLNPDVVISLPGVTRVVQNREKQEIVELLTGQHCEPSFALHGRSRPHLKVQDGCNFRCSYCSVPMARGRSRSVPLHEVIRGAQIMEGEGYREIVLTGIHLGTYGHDLKERTNLANLLQNLLVRTNISRFRLSSLEVNEVDDALIELLQDPRVCRHLHLPLQSGSDKILRLMRRNYSSQAFHNTVRHVTSRVDNISLGTDVIVGFPGEGGDDFSQTCNLLDSAHFAYLHIFPFSPRPLTEAATMQHGVSSTLKAARVAVLKDLNSRLRKTFMEDQIGRELYVVLEEKGDEHTMFGTSGNYLKIKVRQPSGKNGDMVRVRILALDAGALAGSIVPDS
jgi:threonylcarbamoyladenosine tRNA methylthiotransferase MtaB